MFSSPSPSVGEMTSTGGESDGGGESGGDDWARETAPLGIKIVCIVSGLVYTLALFLVLSAAEGLFLLILLVSLGLCFVALYGLWTLESWGWTLYLVLQGTVALGEVIRFDILPLAITVLLMWYVYSKRDLYRAHQ